MTTQPDPRVRTFRGTPYQTIGEFFSKIGVQIQHFSINPARRSTLVGEGGTRLTVFPFSLVDVSGHPVESEVDIFLKEVFSKREMVVSDRVTTSEDRLLESGGQIFVQALQDGRPLQLIQPLKIELPVREKLRNPLGMRLFKGSTTVTRPFKGSSAFDWKMVADRSVSIQKLNGRKYFTFGIHELDWWNCDYFFSRRSVRTMVSAKCVSVVEEFEDLVAYLIFRDTNSVARMYPGENSFTSFNIPVRLAATVIMIGLFGGTLYYGACDIEATSNKLVHVNMQPVSEKQLLENLSQW